MPKRLRSNSDTRRPIRARRTSCALLASVRMIGRKGLEGGWLHAAAADRR